MADRSVVVSKTGPMKAGNSLEEKTRMSMRLEFFLKASSQKKKVVSHTLLSLQKRRDRGEGNVLRQRL
ncbi:hypothetical protein [Paenibacillus sp. P46E]|uniref:hypothetical protein n=1 Tax=Paenibacillus sp. P46E TaxID=1349436 RepID=UPI000940546B|nr:hypothetical protein [Paenibacillus sp. P46E]OKP93848.1 hypothetical protein A3849_30415 [Paenibacillus sp. P46E]